MIRIENYERIFVSFFMFYFWWYPRFTRLVVPVWIHLTWLNDAFNCKEYKLQTFPLRHCIISSISKVSRWMVHTAYCTVRIYYFECSSEDLKAPFLWYNPLLYWSRIYWVTDPNIMYMNILKPMWYTSIVQRIRQNTPSNQSKIIYEYSYTYLYS